MEDEVSQTAKPTAKVQKVPASQIVLEGDEDFMVISPKERAVWIKMMKIRHATLIKKEQDNKKWQESLLQRRVNVYNRSRKLLNAQRDRFRFLFKMSEVIKHLSENKINNEQQETGNEGEDNVDDKNDGNNKDENENNAETEEVDESTTVTADAENVVSQGDNSVPTIVVKEPTQQ